MNGIKDLETRLAEFSPQELDAYKADLQHRLAGLDPSTRDKVYARMSTLPQLSDMVSYTPAETDLWEQPPAEKQWWQHPLEFVGTGLEQIANIAGSFLTAPARVTPETVERQREKPLWEAALTGIFPPLALKEYIPGGEEYEEYVRWKEEEEVPYIPLGIPSWEQWGGWLGLGEKPGTYQPARMDVYEPFEFAPWMAVGGAGGAATKVPKAGQMLKPTKAAMGVVPYKATEPTIEPILASQVEASVAKKETPGIIEKLTTLIKEAKPARTETELLKHKELSQRVAKAGRALEKGEGKEAFYAAKGKLKGELPKAEFIPPEASLSELEIKTLFDTVRTSKEQFFAKINTGDALQKLLLGEIPTRSELVLLENVFGTDLVKAVLAKRPLSAKVWEGFLDVIGLPKALLASFDLSAPLRQGAILFPSHPRKSLGASWDMIKAFGKEKYADDVANAIRTSKYAKLHTDAKLYIAPLRGEAAKVGAREEMFMTRFAQYIPGIKHSERAYITYLNKIRVDVFDSTVAAWERAGANVTIKDYRALATYINNATGRGTLGPLSESTAILNAAFFSPRFVMGRVQTPLSLFSSSALVRKKAAKDIAIFVSTGMGALSLAHLAGADVEMDPRSTDFGKVRIGATRIDFWGGFQPYARFTAQIISGQRKSATGKIYEVRRGELVGRFIRSKEAPVAGLVHDIIEGETFIGEEMEATSEGVLEQMRNRLVPMFIQDVWEAVEQEGLSGGFVATPGLFGATIVSYGGAWLEVERVRDEIAMADYGMTWDELGAHPNYGKATQIELEKQSPELQSLIEEAEKEAEEKASGTKDIWEQNRDYFALNESIVTARNDEISLAAKQFEATGDGTHFRERINEAYAAQRLALKALQQQYPDVVATLEEPLDEDARTKMSPQDLAYRDYMTLMYADDMYDQFGEYRFDEADLRERQFIKQYGQEMLDYINKLIGIKRDDEPDALKLLRRARIILKPYWEIVDLVWSQYPPELRQLADEIDRLEKLGQTQKAKTLLYQYPQILEARKRIAEFKKRMKQQDPRIAGALKLFYSY